MWTWRTSHPEQASGSEGGDASHDQRPLRLQQLEGGVCHHGEAEQPQHSLLARGRLCRLLLLMSSSTSSLGGNLGDDFKQEDPAPRAARGDKQVLVLVQL